MHNKPKSVVEGKSKIREAIAQARRGKPATETKPGDEAAVVSEVVAATEPATMWRILGLIYVDNDTYVQLVPSFFLLQNCCASFPLCCFSLCGIIVYLY